MHSRISKPKTGSYSFLLLFILLTSASGSLSVSHLASASESKSNMSAAPAFSLPGISGHKSLDDYRGQYLYVDFWASWCGPCRQSFPWMNKIQDKYNANGLKIIAINLDENRSDAERFLDDVKADIDIAFDNEGITAEAFDVRGMPSSYLINPDGEIVFSHIGFRQRDTALLEAEIAKVMGEVQ